MNFRDEERKMEQGGVQFLEMLIKSASRLKYNILGALYSHVLWHYEHM